MPKILIGVPCFQTLCVPTVNSIVGVLRNAKYEADVVFEESIHVHKNRNALVEKAINGKYDYLFFVDRDMVFLPNTLERLLAHGKDIISAKYYFRGVPKQPMLYREFEGREQLIPVDEVPEELFKCFAVPTGLLLLNLNVFSKLHKPYFNFEFDKEGNMILSEDLSFCRKARDAGCELWCDPTIPVKHIGDCFY